jgi:glyoxylase-like metal-dependent hydrolase (beta-lactamase superfamily II)
VDGLDRDVADDDALYEVLVVRYGSLVTTEGQTFLNHWIHGEPDRARTIDYFLWIARNGARTIVVDTGFDPAVGRRRGRTVRQDPRRVYELLGVDPATAPTVVVTHAHYDHIGNLSYFPESPLVVAGSELAFWGGPFAQRGQFSCLSEDTELAELAAADKAGRVMAFGGRHEVAPGVEVVEVGGHTSGQSIVIVDTKEGPVLLASDAIHFYDEYEQDRPFAFTADVAATYAAYDRIRGTIRDRKIRHLVSGHDPDTLEKFPGRLHGPPEIATNAAVIGRLS